MRENSFDPRSAVESILFLAHRVAKPTIHEILKLRYFADKLHMSRYGFVASNDKYAAMEFGPVASNTYDLLKAARGDKNSFVPGHFYELVAGAIEVGVGKNAPVKPLRKPDLDFLSPADIECMSEATTRWGNMGFGERTKLSHDDAWEKGWQKAQIAGKGQAEMPLANIAETLDNAKEVLEYMAA